MNDTDVLDELHRVVAAQHFDTADASVAIRRGTRVRRARRAKVAAWGATACVLTTLAVTTQTGLSGPSGPSPAFGDPGSRMSLVGDGGSDQGYPDLVVERTGDKWVTISGFGWPIEGMEPVSGSAGTVAFPEVSKLDAESMCLPMLIQAAPEVPNDSWEHSGAWIDGFPTRSGLITSYAAQYDGRTYGASCTVPGDFNPKVRPDLSSVPMSKDTEAILNKCSYQGHVDFRAWRVSAASRSDETLSAALVSQDDHLARCVLSSDPAQRVTQVSQSPVTQTATGEPVLYGGVDTNTLTIVGSVPASVTSVLVTTVDQTTTAAVRDQTYAIAMAYPEGAAAPTSVKGFDAVGAEVFAADATDNELLPIACFNTVETNNDGC